MFRTPRGMRDIVGEEMDFWCWVEDTVRRVFESFGYKRVETPIFEHFDLFALRSGEEIRNRMFVFRIDEGEVALRPEITASIARLVSSGLVGALPYRLYYIGRCYRYEEPQSGRYREFWQAGVELVGSGRPEADAELLILAYEVAENVGLRGFNLKIGDMSIIRGLLEDFNVPAEVQNRIITPLDKLSSSTDRLRAFLMKAEKGEKLDRWEVKELARIADSLRMWRIKEAEKISAGSSRIPREHWEFIEEDPRIYLLEELNGGGKTKEIRSFIADTMEGLRKALMLEWAYNGVDTAGGKYLLDPKASNMLFDLIGISGAPSKCLSEVDALVKNLKRAADSVERFKRIIDLVDEAGLRFTVDFSLARGLEYYTGMVFEIDYPGLGAEKQICGGGRYDQLIQEFGGQPTPALGFGYGLDRLVLAAMDSDLKPVVPSNRLFLVPISPDVAGYALRVARMLHQVVNLTFDLKIRGVREGLSYASKKGYRYAAIIGRSEKESGKVTIKDLQSGRQETLPLDGVVDYLVSRDEEN